MQKLFGFNFALREDLSIVEDPFTKEIDPHESDESYVENIIISEKASTTVNANRPPPGKAQGVSDDAQ